MAPQNYRRFFFGLGAQLLDALGEAENCSWHHAAEGSQEFRHYLRLSTWLSVVSDRMEWYDATKGRAKKASTRAAALSRLLTL